MKKRTWAAVFAVAAAFLLGAAPAPDAMATPRLRDVRLQGRPAEKMDDLFRARVTSKFAQENVFAEARRAFVERDDDARGHGGVWRGEFWASSCWAPRASPTTSTTRR